MVSQREHNKHGKQTGGEVKQTALALVLKKKKFAFKFEHMTKLHTSEGCTVFAILSNQL